VLERRLGDGQDHEDELFRREVDIGMRLDHPTITRIHGFVERPNSRFVILDRVLGKTWTELLSGPLPCSRYRQLFSPLAQGLGYAHQMGVVHRDLKPENVMLSDDGTIRILDFGMARQKGSTDVTVTGQFKGTPMYCAPEQIIDSKKVAPACDQFSFGLLSFQALSGKFPYPLDPKAPLNTLFARLQQPAAPLLSVWPEAGEQADQVMARMLSPEPEARYPSVEEAFAALSDALPSD
jgi:serine/threonine protein kinase